VKVEVADSGVGIGDEQKARLFSAFREAGGGGRDFGGPGLGLAISKRLAEMMGGNMRVKSEPGKGSVFSFTLKAKRGEEAALPAEAEEPLGSFAGRRALLAEDVEINREIVLALLEPTGLAIDCAENGRAAVDLFSADPGRYDLIFMDVQMPEMDGLEAARRIRRLEAEMSPDPANARHTPIVAMTAKVFREDIEQCLAAGMDDHLGKPLDMREVAARLRKYLSTNGR
jgi:CheY-like chemotaxis protein